MISRPAHAALPEPVQAWRDAGELVEFGGHRLFVRDTGEGDAVPIVILHGFPGSSYDWSQVVPRLAEGRRVVVFDMLGYGLSDKPPEASYSLFDQADRAEQLLGTLGITRCHLLAHDMGNTVGAELLHRHNAGELPCVVESTILTNGSIFIEMAQLTRGQRLALALPGRPVPVSPPVVMLRRSLQESFAPDAPPPPGALDALVALLRHNAGGRLIPKQIRYVEERRAHQSRWTAALVDYQGPLTALWGARDPIAVLAMTEHLQQLRPDVDVVTWPEIGHWPCIEAPERLADAVLQRM